MPNALFESIARFDKVAPRTNAEPAPTAPRVSESLSVSSLVGVSRRMTEARQTPVAAVDMVKRRVQEATGKPLTDGQAREIADRLMTRHAPDDLVRLSNLQWTAIAGVR